MIRSLKIRTLQVFALYAPGATNVRVWMHRRRGVDIGERVFIGTDALIETSRPELVSIGNDVIVGIRTSIIGHFHGATPAERGVSGHRFSVRIEDQAFLGPGVIVLPGVTVGRGAVVTAGSVVTADVPEETVVQGNPARPVARCLVPLILATDYREFQRGLRPLGRRGSSRDDDISTADPDGAASADRGRQGG